VVGIIWPPPREMDSVARERSVSLKRVLRIAVREAGVSRVVKGERQVEGGVAYALRIGDPHVCPS